MPVQGLITEHQGGQRRKNGKSIFLAYLNVRFHSKKIFSHILVWSGDSSSENRISSKLAVISTSSREREREDLFNKRNFHQLYANNGEISRKYQKGTKGTNIEGSSYYMIWTVDFRTRTGSYLTFSLDQQPSSSFTKFMSATMSTSMVTTSIINLSMSMSIYQGP